MLKRTMSDYKVRNNPNGAKIIIDDSEYVSKLCVEKSWRMLQGPTV